MKKMIVSICEYLRNTSESYGDRLALVDDRMELTYEQYNRFSSLIAHDLIQKSINKQPIAVLMKKSVKSIVTFMGIARSGNYYTVIDPKMPEARISKILETFSPKMIICDSENREKASALSDTIHVCCYDDLVSMSYSNLVEESVRESENRIIDTDILYVLFTSGSTGVPKGVIITHRSVIDYIEWAAETFFFDENTIFGNQAPFYFDNSVLDIFSSLRCGGLLHIIPQVCFSFPIRLLEYVRDHRINTVFWVPTVLVRVADMGILDKCDINCLRNVLFAGEVMPSKQLNIWRKRLPGAVFANLYGPTEITVDCTYYICNRIIPDNEPVPIGKPCRNSDIFVLNDKNELVKPGEKGELCVRGSSLSLGYYNNPTKTAEVFVQNPLNNLYEEKIYRTGDIVHYNDRGEIIYDGRNDSQIKHSGHRIELGEIETAVSAVTGVEMNACLHNAESDRLVLFYTGAIDEDTLRKNLISALPDYMIPNDISKLKFMPFNANDKIDRLELKERMKTKEVE